VVLQTAFLSPPVAMSAYYLKQAVKEWSLATIYRGMADFMVIQCIAVALVLLFPAIAMWLPDWLEEQDRIQMRANPPTASEQERSHGDRDELEKGDTDEGEGGVKDAK
jgi:hypothetical protein